MNYPLLIAVIFALLTVFLTFEEYGEGKIQKKTFLKIVIPESIAAILAILRLIAAK